MPPENVIRWTRSGARAGNGSTAESRGEVTDVVEQLRENLGTVLVSLASGGAAALVATWVVLPSLPQFDNASDTVAVRYTPDAASGWAALGGLGGELDRHVRLELLPPLRR